MKRVSFSIEKNEIRLYDLSEFEKIQKRIAYRIMYNNIEKNIMEQIERSSNLLMILGSRIH